MARFDAPSRPTGRPLIGSRHDKAARRPRRVHALALACALLAGAIAGAAQSSAQSIDELNSRIAGAQSEAATLAAQVDARTSELAAASARAQAAAQREAALSATLASGRERAARLASEVEVAEERLDETRERLRRSRRVLADRLVAIYKSDDPDVTAILLSADGFDDLATRAELLERIRSADASLIDRVEELRDQVAAQLAEVEAAERQANDFNERIAAAREAIAAERRSAAAQADALAAARQRQQAAIAALQARVGEWTSEVQRLERVSAQQAREQVSGWVGDWAIPQSIVICESGGNFEALNPSSGAGGAYQIMPSTWEMYGGRGAPHEAPPGEQHRIARQIWRDSGSAAWVC